MGLSPHSLVDDYNRVFGMPPDEPPLVLDRGIARSNDSGFHDAVILVSGQSLNVSGGIAFRYAFSGGFDVYNGGGGGFQQTYAHTMDQDVVTRFDSIAQKLKDLGVDLESEKAKELYEIMKTMPIDELKSNIKAMQLTKEWLEPEEWKELKELHQVTVTSKKYAKYGRTYVVYENGNQRVAVFENGKKVMDLCGVVYGDPTKPGKSFAHGDKLMTKVMSLKANEEYYLSHSNAFPIGNYKLHKGEPTNNYGYDPATRYGNQFEDDEEDDTDAGLAGPRRRPSYIRRLGRYVRARTP